MENREMPAKICEHHKPKDLGYIAWHDWADSMNKKGIKQSQCPYCKLYFFPEEMGETLTLEEFERERGADQPVK